ncbi:hypothetical protein GCM10022393_19230 [Aquimarina addita]|uniref:3-hydroxymyristoyl/3-hydroxydecanoyl-(Acyl carrier protein) dehydratase n=1 Tax=Aquimarina addita TaxID=870485 RepID=A0ABP6UKM0_9FLAO
MSNRLEQAILDKEFIKRLIPQKDPFVMVDRLLYFDTDTLTSGLEITTDNILTDGDNFSEAGLLEHMAQSTALYRGYQGYQNEGANTTPKIGFIGAIKHATIYMLPKIGTTLITTAKIIAEVMHVTLIDIVVKDTNGTIIASSQMKTVVTNA